MDPDKDHTQLHFNGSRKQRTKITRFSLVLSLHTKAAATRGQCDHVSPNQLLGAAETLLKLGRQTGIQQK